MKLSHTLGVTACAALLAASGVASALTTYQTTGVIVQSTCGALSPSLAAGQPSTSTIYYPGQGVVGMVLVTPSSPAAGNATICTSSNAADLTGGSTLSFACYINTIPQGTKIPTTPAIGINSTFKGAATSVNAGTATAGAAINVESVSTIPTGATTSCSFTTDATWTSE